MDHDGDGKISSEMIDIGDIPDQILVGFLLLMKDYYCADFVRAWGLLGDAQFVRFY